MTEQDRTSPWRQGQILTHEAAVALNLAPAECERTVAIVISHDCDLVADPSKEPNVEVIRASVVEGAEGQFTYSKNARKLHLQFKMGDSREWIELKATDKATIPKSGLAQFSPRTDLTLDPSGRSILRRWLAARYSRSAFSDAFDDRLKKSGIANKITEILRPHGGYIRSILFDVDEGCEKPRTDPEDTYSLRIYVVYTTESDPEKAQDAAEQVQSQIEEAFRQKLLDPSQRWRLIELCECAAISDEALTVAQSAKLKEWRQEHLSLREDPPQPTLPE